MACASWAKWRTECAARGATIDDAEDPPLAHEDSRRLPGPNRWFDRPAVVLAALSKAAQDPTALQAWAQRVQGLCAALGWPLPQPQVQTHAQGVMLAFAAPDDSLLTATEVNEWAWERSAADTGALAREGMTALQPKHDDLALLAVEFQRRAAAERSGPLARLKAAARAHSLPVFDDDDSVTIGAGSGSRTWPRAALPLPLDLPWPALHDVPTILVTGSNGKTTTTRLLAAMVQAAGQVPGLCGTEGVVVGGETQARGDYAGPAGARAVLRHPGVQFAVLETARGGLMRRGLALRRADVAVVTNVSADHLGEYGIDDVPDIARAKLVLAHAVAEGGTLVLNGSDAVLMAVANQTPAVQAIDAAHRLSLFAQDYDHPALAAHRAQGGWTCGARGGLLLLGDGYGYGYGYGHRHGETETDSDSDSDSDSNSDNDYDRNRTTQLGCTPAMPLTLQGAAGYNLENIAAAVLAAWAAGLPLAAVTSTLQTFGAQPQDNPGRLERWAWRGATVLVDYAHNPDGLAQLLTVARALQPRRLGLLLGQAGNRDDAAITALAHTAAGFVPDSIVVKELPAMLRGRALGEVPALLLQGLVAAGLPLGHCRRIDDEAAAARWLLDEAAPGDVLVLPVHTSSVRAAVTAWLQAG